MRSSQELRDGNVQVPRLDLEQEPEVYRAMTIEMEMLPIFREGDYAGIGEPVDPEAWLAITRIGHRAVLVMNEEGVEAAAATFVGVSEAGSVRPVERFSFRANRPFLLLLMHRDTDAPLMVAWIANPAAEGP